MSNDKRQEANSTKCIIQSEVFLKSEGDGWFYRNKAAINSKSSYYETETIKRILQSFKGNINNILEIGCSNGAKLNDLCQYFDASGAGIDPSPAAIKDGNEQYKDLRLSVATASNLPYSSEDFDLVHFGSCLCLVDRDDVFKAVAEADRVLKKGGFLIVTDFDPILRHKRVWHHVPSLFCYKNSYADFFTAGGHYYLVAKESFSHEASHFATDSDERFSICILYKEPDAY
jgi:ubiquinone/menaquinone biosynthesis C-methylase UbiE